MLTLVLMTMRFNENFLLFVFLQFAVSKLQQLIEISPSEEFLHLLVFCFKRVATGLQYVHRQPFDNIGEMVQRYVHVKVCTFMCGHSLGPQLKQCLRVLSDESSLFHSCLLPSSMETHTVDYTFHEVTHLIAAQKVRNWSKMVVTTRVHEIGNLKRPSTHQTVRVLYRSPVHQTKRV